MSPVPNFSKNFILSVSVGMRGFDNHFLNQGKEKEQEEISKWKDSKHMPEVKHIIAAS